MKCTIILTILALFAIGHLSEAYDKEKCDAPPTLQGVGRVYSLQWVYNKPEKKCESFFWGGRGKTKNFFDSEEECRKACLT